MYQLIKNLLLVLFFCTSYTFQSLIIAQYDYKIEQLTSNEGLSHDCVQDIFQDSKGFIWIATEGGLNRYDGYNITEFKNNLDDSNSLNCNFVWTIFEDPADSGKILWIGTQKGLSIFNRETEQFSTVKITPIDSCNIKSHDMVHILKAKNNSYLIGGNPGLKKFDRKSGIIRTYLKNVEDLIVEEIFEDRFNDIWIATWNGLFRYKYKSDSSEIETFTRYGSINNGYRGFTKIYEDNNGVLWLGTFSGLFYFDRNDQKVKRYPFSYGKFDKPTIKFFFEDSKNWLNVITQNGRIRINPQRDSINIINEDYEEFNNLYGVNIRSAFLDNSGIIWTGTSCQGIYKYLPIRKRFKLYRNNPNDPFSLSHNWVISFGEDNYGYTYIGTANGSLNQFNKNSGTFYRFGSAPIITRMDKGLNGELWITDFYSLLQFDRSTKKANAFFGDGYYLSADIKVYDDPEKNKNYWSYCEKKVINYLNNISYNYLGIDYLFIDKTGIIWCVLKNTLFTFDPYTKNFNPFNIHIDEPLSNSIRMIFIDNKEELWIGTIGNGLIHGKPIGHKDSIQYQFSHYKNISNSESSLSNNTVNTICEDNNGIIWIGTESGLNKFNRNTQKFNILREKDGLASNVISGVLCDDENNLWISTNKGLSKFDQRINKFTNYNESDGLQSNTFAVRSCFKSKTGEMYFGGSNGFNLFHPKEIVNNPYSPKAVITGLNLFNKPCIISENSPLKKSITVSKEIEFNYNQDVFTFEFSALDFTQPEKNQYAYMMQGVDPDWVYTTADRRFATYTKLDPGEYLFKVKASNNDGIWNEKGITLNVIILPPWWATYWAYSIYAFILGSIIYSIWRFQLNRIHLKHGAEIDHLKAAKYEEMDRLKTRFFANISHEFRTPLTLIIGPAEKIYSNLSSDIVKDASVIKRNATRLLQLVSQLLDLTKLESGKLKLSASGGNIVSFIKRMALSFESLLESKDISLRLNPEKEQIDLYFDREKMTKILTNLLSNACKFTPGNGKIIVSVNEQRGQNGTEFVSIKIKNTGIGIPKEAMLKLFDRFYQADNSFTKEHEGTGIGLALTKELVELHSGNISVNSNLSEDDNSKESWTEFILNFPIGKEHLKEEEIISIEENFEENILKNEEQYNYENSISESDNSLYDSKTIILLVEDNYDMREYIKESLSDIYQIEEAINGEQGIRIAEKIIPDLIISDLMMPKLDGNELTRILKNDEKTSHIPIILLTAKAGHESKLEGLQCGADDYLTKPFDLNELRIRIENLIKVREKLHAKFSHGVNKVKSEEKKLGKIDEKFMNNVNEVIEKYLSVEEFSIEEFGNEVGMSRTQLHRKLKGLVGKSPSQYVRSIRLNRAKNMIIDKEGNISEIAYLVGFSSPAYFTKCFKDEFDYPPSDLLE